MAYRACAPSIRFRRLPTCRTCDLLVPLISMLQQQLPQHLSHQRPPLLRQLARYLIKTRFRMLFPPLPHRLKHLLRSTHKLRLRLLQVYLPSPSQKIWDTPDRSRPVGAIQNGGEFPAASVQLHRLRARRPALCAVQQGLAGQLVSWCRWQRKPSEAPPKSGVHPDQLPPGVVEDIMIPGTLSRAGVTCR